VKQVCLLCERTSPDNNLYCQEVYCPAEMSPTILDYGEWMGDLEIIKPVMILRSSVLYEATHQKTKVFLKVAHPGEENKERLKREAEFLANIQANKQQNEFLPVLLPPYANTTIEDDAYGKTMLRGHLLYFCLFEYKPGEPLRDILTENPQLWINHAGWLMINLATAVNFLHRKGLFHYAISPDAVLVHFYETEEKFNAPSILLFDLGIASDANSIYSNWYPFVALPAYTAPELIDNQSIQPAYATDVYGLGLTLYEMLVGEPTFTYKLHSDEEVFEAIKRNYRIGMNRVEDVESIANIALQAVNDQIQNRQQDASVLVQQLSVYFGQVPGPKPSRWPSLNTIMVIIVTLLTIAFLIALAVSLNEFTV
jgi:serine/threonine protein kinase